MTHPRIPSSTYRLQFNRQFTFTQAREIVPYLDALGISDCYASPYFQARAESLHGYDITDHNKLNAAIGSRAEYHAHGMGQIVDFVPNHMGIGEPLNLWWMDVLENGPSSIHAPWFDIQWKPLKSDLEDKVLLPILGDQYGRVLERGDGVGEAEAREEGLRVRRVRHPIRFRVGGEKLPRRPWRRQPPWRSARVRCRYGRAR